MSINCTFFLGKFRAWLYGFLHFSLPWQGLKAVTKEEKYEKIREKKLSTSIEVYIFNSIKWLTPDPQSRF